MAEIDRIRETQIIARMRLIAIFLVITAHCDALPENATDISVRLMNIASSFAFFGVWLFFLVGGGLFLGMKSVH